MNSRIFLGGLFLLGLGVAVAWADPDKHPIQAAIDAGQIDQARELVPANSDEADTWFGKIALAQAAAGDRAAAKTSLRQIKSQSRLEQASNAISQQVAGGGGTGADFDSLINLITTTVEPDSWDDIGGPGTVQSFPGGVAVDASGVVRKRNAVKDKKGRRLAMVRREATRRRSGNADPLKSSKLRKVSLSRLERELLLRIAVGEEPTDAMAHLAGLYEIQYLFLYPDLNEVVVAGPASGWHADVDGRSVNADGNPVLLLDDLVSVFRNARTQHGRFGCSIDPKREALTETKEFLTTPTGVLKPRETKRWVGRIREKMGLQDVSVYGVDARSHAARILVEADYHMKLVGMGLAPGVPGLESYLASIDAVSLPKSMDVLRWWFTVKPDGFVKNDAGDAYGFLGQAVQLQCENEVVSDTGQRTHTGHASALNQEFADRFTQSFSQLSQAYPVYAELENIVRMALVASVLQQQVDAKYRVGWRGNWLIDHVQSVRGPEVREVPSIVNHRIINRRHVVVGVSGGVTINAASYVRHLQVDNQISTAAVTSSQGKSSEAWWWD